MIERIADALFQPNTDFVAASRGRNGSDRRLERIHLGLQDCARFLYRLMLLLTLLHDELLA
jgi:hypothetical protein